MPSGGDWTKWPQMPSIFLDSKRLNASPKGHCKRHTMWKLAQVLQVRLLLASAKCQKLNKKWCKSKNQSRNQWLKQLNVLGVGWIGSRGLNMSLVPRLICLSAPAFFALIWFSGRSLHGNPNSSRQTSCYLKLRRKGLSHQASSQKTEFWCVDVGSIAIPEAEGRNALIGQNYVVYSQAGWGKDK